MKGELNYSIFFVSNWLCFSGLFGVLDNPELPENAYVMKAIMRCLAAAGKSVVLPVASDVLSKQCVYLAQVSFCTILDGSNVN